mgnify:FL=1
MIYADTAFFIALARSPTSLQDQIVDLAANHEGGIYTSRVALLELLAAAADTELNPLEALGHALEIATVPEGDSILADVAHYIDAHDCSVAEAYHIAYADGDPIVSPNEQLDRLTDERMSVQSHSSHS